ncbi:integral membrane protein [Moniliophthora roreri MCA 2997]|uniref:Integral membrane protein n=1 Tax=Moniliophthora roreri (strain MCA 2997) TaxID=1381753 RepID=V2YV03_MONRO|nr:integral membrane protein [Moniliophthora roreri MCA 2997]
MSVVDRIKFCLVLFCTLLYATTCLSYEVPVYETDYDRQICSGMWANEQTYINVTFDAKSQGQLAMVIYEWTDAPFLGKITSMEDNTLPKTYICTSRAVMEGFCDSSQLGRFILDLPAGVSLNDTSFWSARVALPANRTGSAGDISTSSFWNNPEGNPTPPPSEFDSPFRRELTSRDNPNTSPEGYYEYDKPIQYLVRKTGYYCVAMIPITVRGAQTRQETSGPHPTYSGLVLFRNKFDGKLPATDYPKVNFYFVMFLVYAAIAAAWGWLCYRHVQDILPLQYYLSGLVALLVIEMVANWGYYRYLNAHGRSTTSTVFLIVVAVLDAGRNSMSFFMLLVVCLGLSVVRESLGRTMLKCQALALAHFIFGILYAIGIVELELESTSGLVLLLFVIPLAFTLSGFLLWIMYSLNATIAQLRARKQRYKLRMFERLNYILMFSVLVILIFFVVSSFSFSGRLAEDYAAKSWKVRWWLLDGWLALLYLVSFSLIAYLWRPSENNRRYVILLIVILMYEADLRSISTLAMSDEIAQDEEDAEDYDLEAIEGRTRVRDDDEATLVDNRRGPPVTEDSVVFEIGDEEDDDHTPISSRRPGRLSGEQVRGGEDERKGLMSGKDD